MIKTLLQNLKNQKLLLNELELDLMLLNLLRALSKQRRKDKRLSKQHPRRLNLNRMTQILRMRSQPKIQRQRRLPKKLSMTLILMIHQETKNHLPKMQQPRRLINLRTSMTQNLKKSQRHDLEQTQRLSTKKNLKMYQRSLLMALQNYLSRVSLTIQLKTHLGSILNSSEH